MKNLTKNKYIITFLFIFNLSTAFAGQPNQAVIKNCSEKIEKTVLKLYQSFGYSSKIDFIDSVALLSYRTYKNGTLVGEFSTAPLADEKIDECY